MALPSRKLLTDPLNDTLHVLCSPYCDLSNEWGYCKYPCLTFCSTFCPYDLAPPPTSSNTSKNHPNKVLIIVISLLATTFVLVSCYALYVKFYLNQSRRRRRRSLRHETNQTHEEFLDADHGPIVDHPIWYINTVGLQPSVISCITVCKYKKGDGLVEGTECSVCLNEFQEEETLRLLPKCSHAFHVPCIDTWLESHINCPLCRAPIVVNTTGAASLEAGNDNTVELEETRIGVLENGGVSSGGVGGESGELIRSGSEEQDGNKMVEGQNRKLNSDAEKNGILSIRRSVSLDALSTLEISMAMANVAPIEFDRISNVRIEEENDSGSKSGGRNKLDGSSSNSVTRSISCSETLFAARYTREQASTRPL